MAGNSVPVALLRELFDYCPDTGIVRWKRKGVRTAVIGQPAGYPHSGGYLQVYFTGYYPQVIHRVIWALVHGEFPRCNIDHKNGDRADNRLDNLRLATVGENAQNIHKARPFNKTGLLGVSKHKQRFVATIAVGGKRTYIGIFKTAAEAHAAYLSAKRRLHPFSTLTT
jgi:hypothetical protein